MSDQRETVVLGALEEWMDQAPPGDAEWLVRELDERAGDWGDWGTAPKSEVLAILERCMQGDLAEHTSRTDSAVEFACVAPSNRLGNFEVHPPYPSAVDTREKEKWASLLSFRAGLSFHTIVKITSDRYALLIHGGGIQDLAGKERDYALDPTGASSATASPPPKARQNAIRGAEEKSLTNEISPLAAERIKTINLEDPTEVLVDAMRRELPEAKVGDDEFMVHFLRELCTAYEESKAAYHARMAARYGNLGVLGADVSDAESAAAVKERVAAAVVEKYEAIATVIGEELHRRGGTKEMERVFEMIGPHQQLLNLMAHWAGIPTAAALKDPSNFIAGLDAPDWKIRRDAAQALGELGDPVAVEPLIGALNDQPGLERVASLLVRRAAAEALGYLKDPRALDPLLRALDDEDDVLRRDAAVALGKLKDARAFEPLLRALQAEDYQTVGGAAVGLGELGDERAVEPLLELLRRGGGLVRQMPAVRALTKLDDPRAVDALVATLRDNDLSSAAKVELEQMGGPEAERVLAELRRAQQ